MQGIATSSHLIGGLSIPHYPKKCEVLPFADVFYMVCLTMGYPSLMLIFGQGRYVQNIVYYAIVENNDKTEYNYDTALSESTHIA